MHCKWIGHRHFVQLVDDALAQRQRHLKLDEDGDVDDGMSCSAPSRSNTLRVDGQTLTDLIRIVRKWRKEGRPGTLYRDALSLESDSVSATATAPIRWYDPFNVEIDRIIDHKDNVHKTKPNGNGKRNGTKYLVKY